MMDKDLKWSVKLSDGSCVNEGEGDYKVIDGEPTPWKRLVEYCKDNDLYILNLSLGDIHLPPALYYSLQYQIEGMIGVEFHQERWIQLAAHYDLFDILISINEGSGQVNISLPVNYTPLAPSPAIDTLSRI